MILITIKQLREYRHVKTNIRLLEQELDELILKSSRHDGAGGGKGKSDTVAQIVQEREKTRKRIQLLIAQKNAVDVYISECEPYYGLLLRRHYVEGKTWTAVAAAIKAVKPAVRKQISLPLVTLKGRATDSSGNEIPVKQPCCPICGEALLNARQRRIKFCPSCGQAIKIKKETEERN